MRYTEAEVARVARVAFKLARARRGQLTSVDKANVLEVSALWRRVVSGWPPSSPTSRSGAQLVDSFAMSLALTPNRFDVVLTENLFGDILSDEAGAVSGSLGLLPSASLGDQGALFEPVHGLAPTLAGKDVANPAGAIGSLALLFRHSWQAEDEARAIRVGTGRHHPRRPPHRRPRDRGPGRDVVLAVCQARRGTPLIRGAGCPHPDCHPFDWQGPLPERPVTPAGAFGERALPRTPCDTPNPPPARC